MYKIFTKILPKKIKENYIELLKYNKVKSDPEAFIGFLIFFGAGISIGLSFYPAVRFHLNYFAVVIGMFVAIQGIVYTLFNLQADKKSTFIENILPDFLQLMSSNLRAGMTTDRALLLSAREEFGPFQEEINRLGKEISTGKEIEIALMDLSKRVKSDKLEKTFLLIVNGIKSGGELAELIDQTASNLRSQRLVEERVRTNVLMYVIFIFVAVAIGAPALFGLSTYLVEVLTKNMAQVEIPTELSASQALPISIGKVSISMDFIMTYAIISMLVSGVMGSLIVGQISKGKAKYGAKFIPLIVGLSLIIFFAIRAMIANVLGGVFGLT